MAVDWDRVIGPNMAYFGEEVTYFAKNATFMLQAVFDEAYLQLTPLGQGEMDTRYDTSLGSPGPITTEMPVLGVQMSQFPALSQPTQGDTLLIASNGHFYVVRDVRLDGHGAAKLMLNQIG